MLKTLTDYEFNRVLEAVDRALCQIEWDASNRGDDDNKTDQLSVIKYLEESYKILTGNEWVQANMRLPK